MTIKAAIKAADKAHEAALSDYVTSLPDLATTISKWISAHRDSDGRLAVGAVSLRMVEDLLDSAGLLDYGAVDAGLEAAADAAISIYDALPDGADMLAASPEALAVALSDTRTDLLAQMGAVGTDMAVTLRRELALMTLIPRPLSTVAAVIADAEGITRRRAMTIANTGLAGVQRAIHTATLAGMDDETDPHIWYHGPDDLITRPFCRALAGLAIRREDFMRLDNGQGLSVAQYGGGWNCRHRLIPVSGRFVRDQGIAVATEAELATAQGGEE